MSLQSRKAFWTFFKPSLLFLNTRVVSQSVAYCLRRRVRRLSAVRLQRLPGAASLTVFVSLSPPSFLALLRTTPFFRSSRRLRAVDGTPRPRAAGVRASGQREGGAAGHDGGGAEAGGGASGEGGGCQTPAGTGESHRVLKRSSPAGG